MGFPKQAEQLYQVAFQFIFYTFSLQREIQQKTFGTFVNERHYLTKLQFVWRRHGGAAVVFFFHGVGEVVTRYLQHFTTGGSRPECGSRNCFAGILAMWAVCLFFFRKKRDSKICIFLEENLFCGTHDSIEFK